MENDIPIGRRSLLGAGAAVMAVPLLAGTASAHSGAVPPQAAPGAEQRQSHGHGSGHDHNHETRSTVSFPAMPKSVLQFFNASQVADADAWADAFASDGVFHDPVGQAPMQGREEIRTRIKAVLTGFDPFLGITPVEAYTVGDLVAVSWRGAAVHTSGKPVNWSGINVYQLNDKGLIKEAWAYFSLAAFQAQLA